MSLEKMQGFVTRHARSSRHSEPGDPSSEKFSTLTERGIEQTRERVRTDIKEIIETAPENAVIFLGGASDQERTKDTARSYGHELDKLVYDSGELGGQVEVVTESTIKQLARDRAFKKGDQGYDYESVLEEMKGYLKSPDTAGKKVVIVFPTEVKGFTYAFRDRWTEKGKKSKYFSALLNKHGDSHGPAGLEWLRTQGKYEDESSEVIQGPKPVDVAREYLESLRRLQEFAKRHTDRPMVIGGVGHQWDLDALVTYLASGGKDVTYEKFLEIVGDVQHPLIGETEGFTFQITEKEIKVQYRGKEFVASNNIKN